MWDPPGPGLEPVSPALAGGFLTTAPPGKAHGLLLTSTNSVARSRTDPYEMRVIEVKALVT